MTYYAVKTRETLTGRLLRACYDCDRLGAERKAERLASIYSTVWCDTRGCWHNEYCNDVIVEVEEV